MSHLNFYRQVDNVRNPVVLTGVKLTHHDLGLNSMTIRFRMHSAKSYDGKIAGLYDLEETLGSGHFAVVKLARHVFTGEKVAVKVIDKTRLDEMSRSHLFQEVRCMKLVQHPNVVRLYEVIDTQTKLYLILELGDGGDLYDYIMKHEGGLGEDVAREYFRQIVRAISYCHQLHVVHRDLKPENVVFFERLGVVKLTDFGFSNKFCPGQKLETYCGSLAYCAPEILLGDSYDAPAVDVWSLGVILYMLVAGRAPFREANDNETLTRIMDCKYSVPSHVSSECESLIGRMLVREPAARASLHDIAKDPWLGENNESDYMSLVSHTQLPEEEKSTIVNKMVAGNIASRDDILEALEKNEYNHITATYFLLAERKLRAHRQDVVRAPIPVSVSSHGLHQQSTSSQAELVVPDTTQGRTRKCSIVQEEDEEEGPTSELQPTTDDFHRRGSRSEGKLNLALQERRTSKQDTRVDVKDDSACWTSRRSPTTSLSSLRRTPDPSHVADVILTDSATITLPVSVNVETATVIPTRFNTLPSPSHTPHLNEICEDAIPDFAPRLALYDTRRSKLHKARTASCSSSDASDDDSESRKKRAAKISSERGRRDSHDDSSDSQDPGDNCGGGAGGSGGAGGGENNFERRQQPPPRPQPPPGGASSSGRPHRARRLRESRSLNRITEVQEPAIEVVADQSKGVSSGHSGGFGARLLHNWSRRSHDDKENRPRRVKLLGRYFQVSKKLCIPLPSIISKGRLYKARSCGAIARDRIVSPS